MTRRRTALYGRKSSDDPKRPGKSVRDQITTQRRLAEREGWDVVAELQDDGIGASRHSRKVGRKGFAELLRLIDDGEIDIVAIEELSRATRDLGVYASLVDACADAGLELWVGGRRYDPDDDQDRLSLGISAVVDAAEADRTRKRVQRGVREAAIEGRPHGRLLYGYRREYAPATGALLRQVEDPDQAPVVREAAARVAAGETLYAIAQDLDRRGVPTPAGGKLGWTPMAVKRMVTRPAYVGRRVHQGVVVGAGSWDPILDEATWVACCARLSDPTRGTRRDSAVRHLLSGLAVCGVCGGRVRVFKNRTFLAYQCAVGFCVSRSEVWVDDWVEVTVVERLMRADLIGLLAVQESSGVKAALAEVAELRARRDGYEEAAAAGTISRESFTRIEARIIPLIEAAQRRAQRMTVSPVLSTMAGPDAGRRWEEASVPQRREVIRALTESVRILPTRRGARTFDPGSVEIRWAADHTFG